ncbi:hypothetical protein [Chishuiella sp.]|uniref:hypothetical protein n=1 Tax=Chishuiella sp. TaxID=1969467 RepID=UPI0028AAA6F2|nr:hypothetical protein [Chishuiella sp.]
MMVIKFNTALTNIYGISVNILASYGSKNTGTPDSTQPGTTLATNDNSQVSYISNSIIRIKTGNSVGALSNRSFTFLVTGQ